MRNNFCSRSGCVRLATGGECIPPLPLLAMAAVSDPMETMAGCSGKMGLYERGIL